MTRIVVACLMTLVAGLCLPGCGAELPEPESRPAQIYVRYCSGSGCHGAIPPQRSSFAIWQNQYDRMIDLMRDEGWSLPDAEEEKEILTYLRRHARGGGGA